MFVCCVIGLGVNGYVLCLVLGRKQSSTATSAVHNGYHVVSAADATASDLCIAQTSGHRPSALKLQEAPPPGPCASSAAALMIGPGVSSGVSKLCNAPIGGFKEKLLNLTIK